MAFLPPTVDPVLAAIDAALERAEVEKPPRQYLGASGIGHACERKSWLDFRHATARSIPAKGLRRIDDGHRGERVMADRLRMVPGITLYTDDGDGEAQIGFEDFGGHFRGHADGVIEGLPQAPTTAHVWECKVVDQKKMDALAKLKLEVGEKRALKAWDEVYYAQAQLYMHYLGMTRHYLTACSSGVRDVVTARTEYDEADALRIIAKAGRVIKATRPGARISTDPAWFQCRWCDHADVCHGVKPAAQSGCRTCLHSTPMDDGRWHCGRFDNFLTFEEQRAGCPAHLFVPDLMPPGWKQTDAGDDWVEYTLPDGSVYLDGNDEKGG